MSEVAGYSKRSLADKLGLKAGQKGYFYKAPPGYLENLGQLPPGFEVFETPRLSLDFIQFFTASRTELADEFPALKTSLAKQGTLWISWPKGTSKIPKDLNENIVREVGLATGLVDVKVIAIDADWSGLKFVYRLKDR
ncbi:MAG: DUF3052 family protein [Chloroflexi bacterium]|nr:DUF3052 family protein [Chloroflexota bacterium]OJW04154.1 MAG: hypothetical protein BGO39_06660 [Chloroflexi bacterium 54-19]